MGLNISNFALAQEDAVLAAGQLDTKQPGLLCIPQGYAPIAAAAVTQNTAYAVRVCPARAVNAQHFAVVTTVASVNNPNVDIGVYDTTGALLAHSGNVASLMNASAGVQQIPLQYQFRAQVPVYVLFNYGTDAAPATLAMIGCTSAKVATVLGGAALASVAGQYAVPETFSWTNTPPLVTGATYTAITSIPLIGIQEF